MPLRERTVLITGASRGIGRALALRCARSGARLALCGRDAARLAALEKEIVESGGTRPFWKAFDLAGAKRTVAFYADARDALGAPDVLVNNAGFNPRKSPLAEVTTEEFDAILAVNLRAPFLLCREARRDLIPRRSGHIVQVLSTVCHLSMETMGAYTTAKKGLEGLSGVLRKEARPHGVRVSCVYPGGTDTEFRPSERPDYMRPESVAEVVHGLLTAPDDVIVHSITFRPIVESNF